MLSSRGSRRRRRNSSRSGYTTWFSSSRRSLHFEQKSKAKDRSLIRFTSEEVISKTIRGAKAAYKMTITPLKGECCKTRVKRSLVFHFITSNFLSNFRHSYLRSFHLLVLDDDLERWRSWCICPSLSFRTTLLCN